LSRHGLCAAANTSALRGTVANLIDLGAFLTKVDTGFVKKKCYNKRIGRGIDSIKT
jgi:hypothetical protein